VTRLGEVLRRAEAARQPLSVLVEMTWRCPLRCRHCYVEAPGAELGTATWRRLLEEVRALGALFVTFSGGDVWLRDDAALLLAHARRLGLGVKVLTSGMLLDEDRAALVADLGVLSVEVSLYAAAAAPHDEVTATPGSFARTRHALEALRRRDVTVTLKTPLLAPAVGQVRGIVRLARSLGAGCAFDPLVTPRRDGDPRPLRLRPARAALTRALRVLAEELDAPAGAPPLAAPCEELCAAGARTLRLGPDGTAYACVLYPTPLGRAVREPLAEIWARSPELARLRARRPRDLAAECRTCDGRLRCGRCSAAALLEVGDENARLPSACDVAAAAGLSFASPRPRRLPAAARPR
jgi:pyrroloquinoline quinone biosynthesis protein E